MRLEDFKDVGEIIDNQLYQISTAIDSAEKEVKELESETSTAKKRLSGLKKKKDELLIGKKKLEKANGKENDTSRGDK